MSDTTALTGPLHEQPDIYSRRWFLLGILCLCLVMVVMSVSGINVAIPSMQETLKANLTDMQWIVDSYALVFAGLLLSAGAIGDRFGRKLALMGGLAIFALGSLIAAIATTATMVIVGRSVSGIGAAFVMPATLSLLSAIFPPQERSKAIAIWAGLAGAGAALGPLIVGFLLTGWWIFPARWWGSAFVLNTVVSLGVLVAIVMFVPHSRDESATPLDPIGAVISFVGMVSLIYAIIEGPNKGWTHGVVIGGFAIAAFATGLFIWWEKRVQHPMLPMEFFANRSFTTGTIIVTFVFMVMFGFFFLISQYFQFVKGWTPLHSGIATLPSAITMVIVAPRSDRLVKRFGLNKVVASGFGSITLGFLILTQIHPTSSYLYVFAALLFLASGMATTMAPATTAIMSAVPLSKAGVGSAVNDTTRELGGALGIAIWGSLTAAGYRHHVNLKGLTGQAAAIAHESIGGAIRVGREIGGEGGAAIIEHAGIAYTNAVNITFLVAAMVAAAVGALVLWLGRSA